MSFRSSGSGLSGYLVRCNIIGFGIRCTASWFELFDTGALVNLVVSAFTESFVPTTFNGASAPVPAALPLFGAGLVIWASWIGVENAKRLKATADI